MPARKTVVSTVALTGDQLFDTARAIGEFLAVTDVKDKSQVAMSSMIALVHSKRAIDPLIEDYQGIYNGLLAAFVAPNDQPKGEDPYKTEMREGQKVYVFKDTEAKDTFGQKHTELRNSEFSDVPGMTEKQIEGLGEMSRNVQFTLLSCLLVE